jgi:hypothetical protein
MDIYQTLFRDALRKSAALNNDLPLPRIQTLRRDLRVVRAAAFLDDEEKRFAPGQENRPAMSGLSVGRVHLRNKLRPSATG